MRLRTTHVYFVHTYFRMKCKITSNPTSKVARGEL